MFNLLYDYCDENLRVSHSPKENNGYIGRSDDDDNNGIFSYKKKKIVNNINTIFWRTTSLAFSFDSKIYHNGRQQSPLFFKSYGYIKYVIFIYCFSSKRKIINIIINMKKEFYFYIFWIYYMFCLMILLVVIVIIIIIK